MIFRVEPTGMGITIALPSCGESAGGSHECVSWIVRPAAGEHPRLKNKTELKDLIGRAVVKRVGATQERVGRVCYHKPHLNAPAAAPEGYVVELRAPDDLYDRIAALAYEGKPPSLTLDPHGSGKVWDNELDPQIMLKGWSAEVQVTPDGRQEKAGIPSLLEAQLGLIRDAVTSARTAAWAAAAIAAITLLLRLL